MEYPAGSGLFRADIFDVLGDRNQFVDIIAREFHDHALSQGCLVHCSRMRLYHAHHFFMDDLKNVVKNRLPGGTKADHLKSGAFLGFWLRRMLPINSISYLDREGRREDADPDTPMNCAAQKFFATYGNEFCSFRVAFDIAQYVHIEKQRLSGAAVLGETLPSSLRISPSPRVVKEIVVTLKHKNNSPHSFYTTMLALFESLTPVQA